MENGHRKNITTYSRKQSDKEEALCGECVITLAQTLIYLSTLCVVNVPFENFVREFENTVTLC